MKNKSAITLIVLALGLFYTFTNVEYEKAKELHSAVIKYQDVLANIADVINLRDNLLVSYEEFPADEKARIEKVLPDNVDTVNLALELDGIGARYGISLKDVSIDSDNSRAVAAVLPQNNLSYDKTRVSFSFVSNYQNFKRFLSDVEKNLRLMEIKSVSFRSEDSGLYEHKVTIETYKIGKTPIADIDKDLLSILNRLKEVTLEKNIFSDSAFSQLSDFSVNLSSQDTGRPNPFERLERD
ncbi:MAG: hypothetical protein HYS51_02420 [Candidatus Zambryskibacteria bacterium]|nr:hypothetical protein [Candidatus Zambryskibacteria bacterium]